MNEHEGHEAEADDVERSLDELQERSVRLGDEIEGTGEDWERKQRDPAVPGAVGEPEDEREAEGEGTELDFGRDVDYEALAAPPTDGESDEPAGDAGSEGSPSGRD